METIDRSSEMQGIIIKPYEFFKRHYAIILNGIDIRLSKTERNVLILLAKIEQDKGKIEISHEHIAKKIKKTRRWTIITINSLKAKGFLKVTSPDNVSRHVEKKTNQYQFLNHSCYLGRDRKSSQENKCL